MKFRYLTMISFFVPFGVIGSLQAAVDQGTVSSSIQTNPYVNPGNQNFGTNNPYVQPSGQALPGNSQPSATYPQPPTTYSQPPTTYSRPPTTYSQPPATYAQPSTSYPQPTTPAASGVNGPAIPGGTNTPSSLSGSSTYPSSPTTSPSYDMNSDFGSSNSVNTNIPDSFSLLPSGTGNSPTTSGGSTGLGNNSGSSVNGL